ncbi:AAA family ATPase [Cyclobacterium amurskyense]|uniref:Uncharacterized protein n=1 Tax=Cyclobacterium amurskyense TaxID=320787 RepID=A0A0H4PPP3_9BACT|nr:AAA family ATPase [Cyclobacterium amurskyense]AKP50237.1 hypothetical protein CA2015_0778 [Cyclobacterium amurskyense]
MMDNNLYLNRLVIYTDEGKIAYDEIFHKGVNIIRGNNSSGKSTISHFIFYALGGAFNDWVKEARKCSVVVAEVELNGATVTIKRQISFNINGIGNKIESIYFFWGSFENSLLISAEWQKFNYDTTENKKSFSNVLFENLNLPIVKGENNITFHQILRLLYVDQDSPTNSLFLYEQFDTSLTRETVSDLLLGVYNQNLYDLQQKLERDQRESDELKSEIKVIKKFIPNLADLIPGNINARISNKEQEIVDLDSLIIEFKENNKKVNYTKKSQLEFQTLSKNAIKQRDVIKDLTNRIRIIQLEIEDTDYFIKALENKLSAVRKSIITRDFLGGFTLVNCPECLSELIPVDSPNHCNLCKQKIDNSVGITQARKIEQEISFQIKESKKLNNIKEKKLIEEKAKYEKENIKLHQIQVSVNQAIKDVRSFREERIDKLYSDRGFIEGELLQLRTLLENAELYQAKKLRLDELESDISFHKYEINRLKNEQERLKKDINKEIEKVGVYLLNNDLKRQKEFFEAKEFNIDYRNNLAFISDKNAKYSASSSFYLKNSARFAIFLTSLSIKRMRYPRFILCDNMEDKGIEFERVHNFQRILIKYLKDFNRETYQVIYTTSFIPKELNNKRYCVGDYYTEENPSLKNV